MRRLFKILISLALVLLIVLVVGGFWTYRALHEVPDFYRQALVDAPLERQASASHEMVRQTTALAGNAKRPGRWQATFTTAQINGWLAVDLVQNHTGLLPPGASDPRVAIAAKLVQLGCKYDSSQLSSVISLEVEPYLAGQNQIAIRIRHARAGGLPLPLGSAIAMACKSLREAGINAEQRESQGDPLVVISLPGAVDENRRRIELDTLDIRDGSITVAGETR